MNGFGDGHFPIPHFVHRKPITRQDAVNMHRYGSGGPKRGGVGALSMTELRILGGITIGIILVVLYSAVT